MPEPRKAPNRTKKYEGATKVNQAPSKEEGFSAGETLGNKTYYDKSAPRAIPSNGGSNTPPSKEWEGTIKKMLASGTSPEELVKQGHISSGQIEMFRPFYKAVYTETPPPKTPALNLDTEARRDRKRTDYNDYYAEEYPDFVGGGGMSKASTKYFDKKTGQEINPNVALSYGDKGVYNPNFVNGSFSNSPQNLGSVTLNTTGTNTDSVNTILGNTKNSILQQDTKQPSNVAPTYINKSSQGIGEGFIDKEKLPSTELNPTIKNNFNSGGKVRKAPKRMYANGTDITGIKKQPTQNEQNARKGANAAGNALGGYGAGYYASTPQENDSESVRASILGATAGMGPIGGAISGIAGIGDKVGAPVKNRNEATDEFGNLKDPTKAKQSALLGAILSPSKALAYRKESGNWTDIDGSGYTNYLETNAKKKIAEEKAIKDKEKFNVALDIANQERGFYKGGTIKGKGGPTEDAIKTTVSKKGIEEKSFIVPAKNNEAAKMLRATILGGDPNKVAQFKKEDSKKSEIAVSAGEHIFTPKEKQRIIAKLGEEVLEDLAPESEDESKEKSNGGGVNETMPERVARMKKEEAEKKNKPYSASGAAIEKSTNGKKTATKTTTKKAAVPRESIAMKQINMPTETMNQPLNDNEKLADYKIKNTEMKPETNYANAEKPKSGSSIWDKTGNVGEYGAALGQIGVGAYNLNKTKRPIYSIDPDYGAALNNANEAAAKAKEQSQYGFDKNQQFLLDQENKNLTDAQRFTARNVSGGSAANAYNMERDAINEGFFRNLKGKVASNSFKMEKQNLAQDRQAYANQLLGGKLNMQRQIFQDAMNQFTQRQNSGSELVGAGIRNAINAKRYNDELNFQKEQNQLYPNI